MLFLLIFLHVAFGLLFAKPYSLHNQSIGFIQDVGVHSGDTSSSSDLLCDLEQVLSLPGSVPSRRF